MTALETIRKGWENAARDDAMFNILTTPGKDGGRWDLEEFFARGREEIAAVMERFDSLGLRGPRDVDKLVALDFGCGVGRLTLALADYYALAVGVDVSQEMVTQARNYAGDREGEEVHFVLNTEPNLVRFQDYTFDFIYSCITLQHMPHDLQQGYISEFLRLLTPDGAAVFHLPEGPEWHHEQEHLSMYGTAPKTVKQWVKEAGGEILDVERTDFSGDSWVGWRYTAGRAS